MRQEAERLDDGSCAVHGSTAAAQRAATSSGASMGR
jgi:hypothetical protein